MGVFIGVSRPTIGTDGEERPRPNRYYVAMETAVLPAFEAHELPGLEADVFRPIQYLGSKLRLLDSITEAVDDVSLRRGPNLDLFCGSGVVSRHLGRSRPMVAVDIQEFSRVVTSIS